MNLLMPRTLLNQWSLKYLQIFRLHTCIILSQFYFCQFEIPFYVFSCIKFYFDSYSFLFDFCFTGCHFLVVLFYKIKVCFSFCSSSSHELFTLFMLSSYFHVRIVTFMLSIRFLSSCVIYREAISRFDGTED